jgi:hypothetical protein
LFSDFSYIELELEVLRVQIEIAPLCDTWGSSSAKAQGLSVCRYKSKRGSRLLTKTVIVLWINKHFSVPSISES